MGICQSKKKQHPKEIVIIQAFSAPQLILQENQAVKPSHPRTKSESQYLTVRRASRKTENEVPTPSSFMKSPLIICKDKSNVFDLQRGFFKKYTTLKFIETESTLYCQHNVTAQYVKVTILDMNSENNQKFLKQIKQYNLQCPNICQFLETFQERDQIYLVQEHFKGGSLSSLLESGTLGYDKAIQIINQIIQAINFLHCLNLIHGSLTLDSFSVSDQNNLFVKLSDLNPIFNFEKYNADEKKKLLIAQYKSPENDRSIKNDVWAIGIIIHQLLTSESPLKYEKLKWKPTEKLTNKPQDGVLALQSMLDPNPQERCSLKEIIEKQYFKANINSDTLQQSIVNLAHAKKMTQFQSTIVFFMMNKFQAEQVQILTKLFDQGDLDNDGLLDKKELEYLFKIIIPDDEIFIKSQIDSIFLNIDVDNSGAISVNEFVTAASNKKELLQEYNLEGCFRILCNNQGGITAKSIARKIQINENAIKSEIQDYVCDQIDLNTFKEINKMNDCSCAKCLSKICKTQPISMTIDYPRSFQTDYKSEFSEKISTEPLRMNLSSYKPDVPSLIQESIYKSQYRTLKTEKIAPIKQQQNLYTVNSLQLDDQSIYKRSFRSLTFQERTQPIKPSNVHCVSSLPMSAVRSTYRQNFGQRQFQYPQKCIVPYKLHTSGEWDKNIQSHYRQEHRGEMTEQAHKFKPNQNQLFIMNYQRKPQSQYQQDFRGKYIKCKNHEVNALAN